MNLHLAAALCALALAAAGQWIDLASVSGLLFVAVAISVGMSHGALDAVILMRADSSPGVKRGARGLRSYALICVICAAALSWWPQAAVPLLLLVSALHFGAQTDTGVSRGFGAVALRLACGGAAIAAPMLLRTDELAALLGSMPLLFSQGGLLVWQVLAAAWLLALTYAAGWAARRLWRQPRDRCAWQILREIALVLFVNALLPPLLAFAVYFGLVHSLGYWHAVQAWRRADPGGRPHAAARRASCAAAASFALALAGCAALAWHFRAASLGDWVSVLLIGIAAVTVAHAALVERHAHALFGAPGGGGAPTHAPG